jgi:hypothetical protein
MPASLPKHSELAAHSLLNKQPTDSYVPDGGTPARSTTCHMTLDILRDRTGMPCETGARLRETYRTFQTERVPNWTMAAV